MIDSTSGADLSLATYFATTPANTSPGDSRPTPVNSAKAQGAGGDELVLSDVARQAMSAGEATFDKARVDAIKEAITNGSYPLDSRRIAESFVILERLIGGPGA